jgi:hypothetical protein
MSATSAATSSTLWLLLVVQGGPCCPPVVINYQKVMGVSVRTLLRVLDESRKSTHGKVTGRQGCTRKRSRRYWMFAAFVNLTAACSTLRSSG